MWLNLFFCSLISLPVTRFHRGDVLVTTATGVMTEEEGEKWGLVPTHAYAVLDIRDHKVRINKVALACQHGLLYLSLKGIWKT